MPTNQQIITILQTNWPTEVSSRKDADLCRLVNAIGNDDITETTVTKGRFMSYLTPLIVSLPSKTVEIQAKWDRAIRMVLACDNGVILSEVAPLLSIAVSDGVISSEQVALIGVRKGSKAETIGGAGYYLTLEKISSVLNSQI